MQDGVSSTGEKSLDQPKPSSTSAATTHHPTEPAQQTLANGADAIAEDLDAYMAKANEAAPKIDLTQPSACPCHHHVLNYQVGENGTLHVPTRAGSISGQQPTASKKCTCDQALEAAYRNSCSNAQG
ncbi:hypothetical protein BU16DRAFT_558070 [Lophium mytilinum]|uniref:Uncharacterized protein n=1 Tax=Lophium mytilinum TaxID=390894 RepID=A0A6A6R8K9_9PEZI|nr:hypothetical protein BU16DRAFT_558070 [Lophium mytilinum]